MTKNTKKNYVLFLKKLISSMENYIITHIIIFSTKIILKNL